jgi:hypothetical protein
MAILTPSKQKAILYGYIASQWAGVFCAFAGSLFSLYDLHQPDGRGQEDWGDYSWNLGCAFIAASITAYIAQEFQGKKIGVPIDAQHEDDIFTEEDAPRTTTSNTREIAFFSFATLLLSVNNYFTLACAKAMVMTFDDPTQDAPILPLSTLGLTLLFIKTILIDLPFNATNAFYETGEEIKKKATGAKAGSWISRPVSFFSTGWRYKPALYWIKTAGVFSHGLDDFLGLLLTVPPSALIRLYDMSAQFWVVISTSIVVLIPVLYVNYIQTKYFEGAESEGNMRRCQPYDEELARMPLVWLAKADKASESKKTHALPCLNSRFTKWIRCGLYTQGPFHAFGDVMPVVLFLRDIASRAEWSESTLLVVAIPLAIVVFFGSCFGTHYSEVTSAIARFDEDFLPSLQEDDDATLSP